MKLLSGSTKIAFGFGLGVMTAELLKELMPVFRELRRPLLKAAVQSGEILARTGRLKVDQFRETVADLHAEIQSETARPSGQAPLKEPLPGREKQNAGVM